MVTGSRFHGLRTKVAITNDHTDGIASSDNTTTTDMNKVWSGEQRLGNANDARSG